MSFYRIYRPQIIDEIDNGAVREQLLTFLGKERSKLPHAFFFTGPKGTGKTTAARVIAKLFNCTNSTPTGPCGACEQCMSITKGMNLDVIEMDAASNRGIDEMRQLRDRINLTPTAAAFTVYIIDEVHMLTTEAFNALLKTLEEPPRHAVFVLATTDAHKVPATIKSRCVELNFHKATTAELVHALQRIVDAEKISISNEGLTYIAGLADGSFRDAVKYLEQASLQAGKVTEESLQKLFATPQYTKLTTFLTLLFRRDIEGVLKDLDDVVGQGIDLRAFLTFILHALEADMVSMVKGEKDSKFGSLRDIQHAIRVFGRAYEELRISPVPKLPVELAIIEFCYERTEQAPAEPATPQKEKESPPQPPTLQGIQQSPSSPAPAVAPVSPPEAAVPVPTVPVVSLGLLTLEKLVEHWSDFIATTKPINHSVAGVLRSSRPKAVEGGIVTIEAFYKFHQEKLADIHTKQVLADVLKKLFGEKVKIEIVLGKK